MGNITEKSEKSRKKTVMEYIKSLSAEHKMLIVLKNQLYGGKWEPMYQDLKNRLEGKPYIFKLANRINDDLERIEQMRKFEKENYVDLGEHVESVE